MQTNVKEKYISRLNELIKVGSELPEKSKQKSAGHGGVGDSHRYKTVSYLSTEEFNQWKTNCISILDVLIPPSSIHRATIDKIQGLSSNPSSKEFGVSFLRAIVDDFENDYFDDLYNQIDAELNADFLTQAESLIQGKSIETAYIPAAVIAGAVLEHSLRNMYNNLEPPEPIKSDKPLMLAALIDCLKRRGVYNEVRAKELRSFSGIRNAAAHGNFDEFTPDQVSNMLRGISSFLASYS